MIKIHVIIFILIVASKYYVKCNTKMRVVTEHTLRESSKYICTLDDTRLNEKVLMLSAHPLFNTFLLAGNALITTGWGVKEGKLGEELVNFVFWVNLSCGQIQAFVNGHNFRRWSVAQGAVLGQPAASDMMSMVWDEELAEKAARWAENGVFSHNPDRTIGSQRWPLVGENIYYSKFWSPLDINIIPNIEEALMSWFNEHVDYGFYPFTLNTAKVIGHYTQMVWGNSNRVGCGISQKKENNETFTFFVCNYGPTGNYLGQLPYTPSIYRGYLQSNDKENEKPYGQACSF